MVDDAIHNFSPTYQNYTHLKYVIGLGSFLAKNRKINHLGYLMYE